MKRFLLPLLALVPALAPAAPRVSRNYSLTPEGLVPGGFSSSRHYALNGALDTSAGPIGSSADYTLKPGFVAQLHDVVGLSVTAERSSVDEGDTNQITAAALLDDRTTLAVPAQDVAWSVVAGPVSGVNAAGLAQTVPTFATMPATVQGSVAGRTDTVTFTVLNLDPDDTPPVAADGIDDSWQFEHFDADEDDTLSNPEASNANPGANPDRDPNSNLVEWLTGFDPNDPNAYFQWFVSGKTGNSVTALANKVIPGTIFRFQSTLDLSAGPWLTVDSVTPGAEAFNHPFVDPNAVEPNRWYRLELQKAP